MPIVNYCSIFSNELSNRDNQFSVTRLSGLGNPFSIGAQCCVTGTRIEDKTQLLQAYRLYLLSQIELGNPTVVEALDDIAYALIEGKDIVLLHGPHDKHMHIIEEIVRDKISSISTI